MDWIATNWPILAALLAFAVAWGRLSQRTAALESKVAQQGSDIRAVERTHAEAQQSLAGALEAIRIALAELKAEVRAARQRGP